MDFRELARVAAAAGSAVAPAAHADLLRSIAETARLLLDARACSIALAEGEELVFSVVVGTAEEEMRDVRIPATQGIAGWVYASGQAMAVEDVQRDPRFARDVAESVGYVPGAILAMPLETARGGLGVIEVLDAHDGRGGEARDLEVLSVFARMAAMAIESQRAFAQMGGLLLRGLASSTEDDDLAGRLRTMADEPDADGVELAGLASAFAELGRLGDEERAAAVGLVEHFLSYVRRSRR